MLGMPVLLDGGGAAVGYYWEYLIGSISETRVGLARVLPSEGTYIGNAVDSIGWRTNGEVYALIASHHSFSTYTTADVISVLTIGGFVWFAKNGVIQNSGDPIRIQIAGIWRPAVSIDGTAAVTGVTARFAPGSWTYAPPAGFAAIGAGAVWLDEGSGTVAGSGLQAQPAGGGVVTNFRADTDFVVSAEPETLSDLT